jgi:hypothetical protein
MSRLKVGSFKAAPLLTGRFWPMEALLNPGFALLCKSQVVGRHFAN